MLPFKKWLAEADYMDDDSGHWASDSGEASGVLTISRKSGRICLGWRNVMTHTGDCWGVFGGAVQDGKSPAESAKSELREETGYSGKVKMFPAYVFKDGAFKYFNFVGLVDYDFQYRPSKDHSWEIDKIRWFTYPEVLKEMREKPNTFHPGVITLFEESKELIEKTLQDLADSTRP